MHHSTLVSAADLKALVTGKELLVILDAGFDLTDPEAGARAFAAGHIPGAKYIHLDRDLSTAKTGRNGRHPLPSRDAFAAKAGAWGISPETRVVVYDRQGGPYAARAWWMLRWLGHADVSVLDGGYAAWIHAGGSIEGSDSDGGRETSEASDGRAPGSVTASASAYPSAEPLTRAVDADALAARLGEVFLLDARAPERYRGEVEPLDARAGHIPGAHNRFFQLNLQPDGRFKPPAELRAEFDTLLHGGVQRDHVIHQCGSGVTACHNLLAMEIAGITGSALYPGSWSEWSTDPSRPVAVG